LQNAPTNTYVLLGPGTYNLNTGICVKGANNVELRGSGASSTFLVFTGAASCMGGMGPGNIGFQANDTTYPKGVNYTQVAPWNGGTQGATSIVFPNGVSNLSITPNKTLLMLDECDTGFSGNSSSSGTCLNGSSVDNGQYFNCGEVYTGATGCGFQGADTFSRNIRGQVEIVQVTSCTPSCSSSSSTTVNLTPGLIHPNWYSSSSPEAWVIQPVQFVGVKDLSIDAAGSGSGDVEGIGFYNASNVWAQRVRVNSPLQIGIWLSDVSHASILDNYIYNVGQNYAYQDSWGIKDGPGEYNLVQNNIIQATRVAIANGEGPAVGDVTAYNFAVNQIDQSDYIWGAYWQHANGDDYVLYEGNVGTYINEDDVHGTHDFITSYRNMLTGWESCANGNCGSYAHKAAGTSAIQDMAYNRYANILGNVLGDGTPFLSSSSYQYQFINSEYYANTLSPYNIGSGNIVNNSSAHIPIDNLTVSSAVRWGNYDLFNNAALFCSGNGTPTSACIEDERAASDLYYPGLSSPSTTLPASFYLTSQPSWWPNSIPFPAVGPDVTGGNIGQCNGPVDAPGKYNGLIAVDSSQCAGSPLNAGWAGGHAYAIPAMNCFLNVMQGPPDGVGGALNFDPSACYGSIPLTQAATPTFSPAGGAFTSAATVSISDSTSGATIYYTTDGTTPTISSPMYSSPIAVSTSETVRAIAVVSGYAQSQVGSATFIMNLPTAAKPTFSVAGGNYSSAQSVSISDATFGATIYYTTDGTTPTTNSSVYSSPINVSTSETLKAMAIASGLVQSPTASATYIIGIQLTNGTFTITNVNSGLNMDLPGTSPAAGTFVDQATPSSASNQQWQLSSVGGGVFTLKSMVNTALCLDVYGQSKNNGGQIDAWTCNSGSSNQQFTIQPVQGNTYTIVGVQSGLAVEVPGNSKTSGATLDQSSVNGGTNQQWTIQPETEGPTATPTFSPAGGTFTSVQSVTISDSTPSATINYTTDGTTPTTNSSVYSSPISVSASETLKAIATASGLAQSATASATYTLNLPVAAPAFSPAAGTYASAQSVTISDSTPGTTIYYTTDGSTPTTSSATYSGPITVSATEILQAMATAPSVTQSAVVSSVYTIGASGSISLIQESVLGNYPSGAPNGGGIICNPTCPAFTITPTGAGDLLFVSALATGNGGGGQTNIQSITCSPSCGTWVLPGAMCQSFNGDTGGVDCGYVLSSAAGATTVTVTMSGSTPYGTVYFREYRTTQPTGFRFDNFAANFNNSCTSCVTPDLTLSGANDVLIATGAPAGQFTAMSGPYGDVETESYTLTVLGDLLNTSSGTGATITQNAANKATLYTIAFTDTPPPTVATPTFTPAAGTYTSTQSVTISDATTGATIYYTSDGSTPTTGSSVYSSPISVSASATVKAIATASGFAQSAVASATYTINIPFSGSLSGTAISGTTGSAAAAPVTLSTGTSSWAFFNGYVTNASGPALVSNVTTTGGTPGVYTNDHRPFSWTGGTPTASGSSNTSGLDIGGIGNGFTFTVPAGTTPQTVNVYVGGWWTGGTLTATLSDNSAPAYTDSSVRYDPNVSSTHLYNGVYTLTYAAASPGQTLTISWKEAFDDDGGPGNVSIQATSIVGSAQPSQAATPMFTPAAGTYTSAQSVTISDATAGASIFYTTDGTAPTSGSTAYSGAITVSASETINAIAVASGYANSAVGSAAYTINIPGSGTITYVQGATLATVSMVNCPAGQCPAVILQKPVAAGDLLYVFAESTGSGGHTSVQTNIASISCGDATGQNAVSCGTWVLPGAACQAFDPNSFGVDCGYVLSAAAGAQSVIVTMTGGTPYSTMYVREYHTTQPTGFRFDAVGVSVNPSCDNCATPSLTLSGMNDVLIAGGSPQNQLTGVNPPYGDAIISNATGSITGDILNTSSGAGATLTGNAGGPAALSTIAFTDTPPPPAATPTFSPAAGTYTSTQSVTISDATTGATIYYTTDGSTPTTGSSVYSSPISVSASETLNAIAAATGYTTSTVASAAYVIDLPAATTPTFTPAGGMYNSTQSVTISDATSGATIHYTTDGSTPTTSSPVYGSPISVSASETLKSIATASGYTQSAVGSAAYTINLPAATPTFSPAAGTYTSAQSVTISDATSGATIYYTTDGSTPTTGSSVFSSPISVSASETLKAIATAIDYTQSAVGSAAYTINLPAAATPTFSPVAGTYTSTQSVTISDATPGATIYFTTNGTPPTTSSSVYVSPITVSANETLQAIATASGYTQSAVGSASYTITPPAATPTFSPAGGSYIGAQSVTISDSTPGATIYYTTNGSTPTTSSNLYSGPITVSSSETIQAAAQAPGYSMSAVVSAAYTITAPPNPAPTISGLSPSYVSAGGPAFKLTVNGSAFNAGSTVYWGGKALATKYVSNAQLTAQVPASNVASAGIVAITVTNPNPGGGTSNPLQFEIDSAPSGNKPPAFTSDSVTITAGSSATYQVTLPSGSTSVSAFCLNLPGGASCSYSASSNSVVVTTSSTTPQGTYQITVVFTETVGGAAAAGILLPILLLPLASLRKRPALRGALFTVCLIVVASAVLFVSTGCGGGSGLSSSSHPNPTQQITSSGTVNLVVQ
jgi:hypothetical protein